jgi:hydroxyacylglutathione hydrolase
LNITINTITHSRYNSNSYLIKADKNGVNLCLVDIGNAENIFVALSKGEQISHLFITHAHLDHIWGIAAFCEHFPECMIYMSAYTKLALANSKLNLSFYHSQPIEFSSDQTVIVSDGSVVNIGNGLDVKVMATPGHNQGSLCFKIPGAIFTGDSLIPNHKVVTKLKSGNKQQAANSVHYILNHTADNDVIYPGHGPAFVKKHIDVSQLI